MQKRVVNINIKLPMEFPDEWSDDDIWFNLNESSWCWSNLISLLEQYSDEHGCLCNICEGVVIPIEGDTDES